MGGGFINKGLEKIVGLLVMPDFLDHCHYRSVFEGGKVLDVEQEVRAGWFERGHQKGYVSGGPDPTLE